MPAPAQIVRSTMAALLREPEDAALTGGRRSLMRRVLGLNVTQPSAKPVRSLPVFLRKNAFQQAPAA